MELLKRSGGAHRTTLSGRARVAGAAVVAALVLGGGSAAITSASAAPRVDQRLGILGQVTACGPGQIPMGVDYKGNTGDQGRANMYYGNYNRYDAQLRHVSWGGEAIVFTIHCSGRPKARVVTRTV